jgi:hypothetical protein
VSWNGWSAYWGAWIILGFCVPEFYCLFRGKPQNTLSYQVWHLEGNGATFARYFVFAFLLWLLIHMVFRAFK